MRTALDSRNVQNTPGSPPLEAQIRSVARPLRHPGDLDPLLERIGDARCVLLGEASHGTSEYYLWRMLLSRRLIEEKGFSFIAVEGDWPDCQQVNRYVKGYADSGANAHDVLHAFSRWPTWMWANAEVAHLAEWMRRHNGPLPLEKKAGFYGLDVYSLWESMEALIAYLGKVDPAAAAQARRAYGCFEPFGEDAQEYAWSTAMTPRTCEDDVVSMLTELRRRLPQYPSDGAESKFDAEQNALVAQDAEHYYRAMIRSDSGSWNVRDTHMADTLDRLLEHHGPESKAIIWAHNTHIGDARATDMARAGMVNLGQLARERRRDDGVVLVGFGGYEGDVIAGDAWGAPMERMTVPPAREESWEDALHRAGPEDKLLLLDDAPSDFFPTRGHRAIGVVYHAGRERYGNYVPTVLPERYDAFLYFDGTRALHPLHMEPQEAFDLPETFPSAV